MRGNADGFSLVELLVAVVFFGFFGLAVQQFCRTAMVGVRVLEAASEAQETARLGVQLIVADAREAGFSPAGRLADGVEHAAQDAFAIARDLDGDGDVNDANERVRYQYAPDRHALLRGQGDAPPQPLLGDLDDDGLVFAYLGDEGERLPDGELDPTQRARIRRVAVRLRIAIHHPYSHPLRVEQEGTATLRNVP